MHKPCFMIILILMLLLLLSGCRFLPNDPPEKPIVGPCTALPVLPGYLVSFSFSESHSYRELVQGYDFREEDDKCTAYFWLADEEEPYPVPVDDTWVDQLAEIVQLNNLIQWDGFNERFEYLMDGTSFSISLLFSDGTTVEARGYGRFPEGYSRAAEEIDAHFMQLLPEDIRTW